MTEPPINRNPADLDPIFRAKLERVLGRLAVEGQPWKFNEGFRTVERQKWLYGQGRGASVPYARPGKVVTQKNGTDNLSNHQGTGKAGSGRAADCYPLIGGKMQTENVPEAIWERYAKIAEEEGLTAGHRWASPHDSPHIELRLS